ncbi:MAG: magnesium protoporphyrin IX methyltransferase [Pseudomonadota bacterium]
MAGYADTRARVESYFDRTAPQVWARLTSDAPVSRIRETVRAGRDEMRALILSRLPDDLNGCRILDAGCGTGQMTRELAERGAQVTAVDISPTLVGIASDRLPARVRDRVDFRTGDMRDPNLGRFDHVLAMDSLIYYGTRDIAASVDELATRTSGRILFTFAPKTALLMAMWTAGKLFPRSDRSPRMVPQSAAALDKATARSAQVIGRVHRGFYISELMELQP